MSFKDLLIQAKDGSHYAQEKIFLLLVYLYFFLISSSVFL